MIEAAFGEPSWRYGDEFEFVSEAKRIFPEPPKPEPEKTSAPAKTKKKRRGGRQADERQN